MKHFYILIVTLILLNGCSLHSMKFIEKKPMVKKNLKEKLEKEEGCSTCYASLVFYPKPYSKYHSILPKITK